LVRINDDDENFKEALVRRQAVAYHCFDYCHGRRNYSQLHRSGIAITSSILCVVWAHWGFPWFLPVDLLCMVLEMTRRSDLALQRARISRSDCNPASRGPVRWLKILWQMWQRHQPYDETRHALNQQRHGSWVLQLSLKRPGLPGNKRTQFENCSPENF
jgi:hypothetical protein